MKTFVDLIEEVQKPGLCHHCGGCVSFCTSVNYGALEADENGMPRFKDRDKCIECGLCYTICPEIGEMEAETNKMVSWKPPMGKVIELTTARALAPETLKKGTDGGVVTAILVHLFDTGRIDGAIVTHQTGPFNREPHLAVTRQDIIDSAGFFFDTSHGMRNFGHDYSTYSPSVQEFRPVMEKGLNRIALVGTPCQIKAVRKIEALGIVPSDAIKFCLGLFCSGNFIIDEDAIKTLEKLADCHWEEIEKVNIKENFMMHLKDGRKVSLPLEALDFMKRYACRYCRDYSAEYADISFGGIGAKDGWTTVITRTPLGRAVLADAKGKTLEISKDIEGFPQSASQSLDMVRQATAKKSAVANANRATLS
ncbi:MAG: Coenzyme F420 hydrogenase/dehydrogenase, beta subunit C-terminal domain [Thermodesulfobacteriota bacterium]|nr:Coenzyme F420 hydrogenase/dehydrogenase, beta subunit C-terminal domain [Thermodesulfobacteriota bacterium]